MAKLNRKQFPHTNIHNDVTQLIRNFLNIGPTP